VAEVEDGESWMHQTEREERAEEPARPRSLAEVRSVVAARASARACWALILASLTVTARRQDQATTKYWDDLLRRLGCG
jgi:hypothetical protein